MADTVSPRRGTITTLTIDADAMAALRAMSAGKHMLGHTVSVLIRKAVARKEERQRLKEKILAAFENDEGEAP
jgi:hypothetical protein